MTENEETFSIHQTTHKIKCVYTRPQTMTRFIEIKPTYVVVEYIASIQSVCNLPKKLLTI